MALWVIPCNLWDGQCVRSLDTYFAGGKGVTTDFVMKPGSVSILQLDYAPGEYRIFLQRGTAIPMTKGLKGKYAKSNFQRVFGKYWIKSSKMVLPIMSLSFMEISFICLKFSDTL